jgi:multidrug efflux pump
MMFTDIFIRRPVLACVISLMILLFGLHALRALPLRQFPKMENTVITISTAYPGASAELMQGFITSRIQKAIADAEGIDYITASSVAGLSTVTAYIKLNVNSTVAMTDIMSKTAQVSNDLPKESNQPVIAKSTGSDVALMYIGFDSDHMSTQQITDYVARVIQPKLQTVYGVASADILGGKTYAMRIWMDSERMAALNITTTDVMTALQTQNFQTAAGQLKGKYVLFNINIDTSLTSADQFKEIVVKNTGDTLVHLKDIAKVDLGAEDYESSVIFNGKTAVFIGIKATPSANPLTVIDNVKKVMPQLTADYPPAFEGKIVYDSTDYIRSSIHEVMSSIAKSSLIVIFVIFLFLGAFRTVLIPIITIPLSLIGVTSLMLAMGYSINLLTLLAMVLAIGLVVDDAIVVVENIYRHIEEGLTPLAAAYQGAREIALPIISMTTTLAAVYAPIGFMSGVTGALFKEFAFTLAFCVIISGIIALTLSPMMCSKILTHEIGQNKLVQCIDLFFENLKHSYHYRLETVLQHRSVVAVFAAIILVFCGLLALTTSTELAPEEDQSVIFAAESAPAYANINYLTKYTAQINKMLQSIPETQDYFIINGMGGSENAITGLILKPWDQRSRSQKAVLADVSKKFSTIAGLNAMAFPLPSIPGTGDSLPLQFVITSTADYVVIYQVMEKLMAAANKSGLFMFVDSNLKFDKPELEIKVDRSKAASMGVPMQSLGVTLASFLGGNYINRFSDEGQSYQVIPQVPRKFRLNPDKINDFYVAAANNQLVPLSSFVSLTIEAKPTALNQFQQMNSATLQGLPMPGKSLAECLSFLKQQAKEIFPAGLSYDFAGQSRQAVQEGSEMVFTFFFALLIIYLVLAAQFESFRDPFIILISVPMSIAGALIPLNLGFATLNIYTGIGLVTLIGLISKHGILIVDFANKIQQNERLSVIDAVSKAASLRLRPILMTTAAMVLGVVPLIFASGAGAASRYSIGLVIASGMLVGTCFTLFVVPAMYTFFARDYSLLIDADVELKIREVQQKSLQSNPL